MARVRGGGRGVYPISPSPYAPKGQGRATINDLIMDETCNAAVELVIIKSDDMCNDDHHSNNTLHEIFPAYRSAIKLVAAGDAGVPWLLPSGGGGCNAEAPQLQSLQRAGESFLHPQHWQLALTDT